jgi:undecaprenyl-diphosphatase
MPLPEPAAPGGEPLIRFGEAIALGALHGPTELLPISSSAHTEVVPWLLGWEYASVDSELRKAFAVALHAGTAAALLIALRGEVLKALGALDLRRGTLIALSFAPPAVVGYALERPIERLLGLPGPIAVGLLGGSAAMAVADRSPQDRTCEDAGAADALWLGAAQTWALMPGVSRNGATLAAARARRFTRVDAALLSRHAALPVIAGATVLKVGRLRRRGVPAATAAPMIAGALASFASTLGCTWLVRHVQRDRSLLPYALRHVQRDRSLLPYALYRTGVATVVLRRMLGGRTTAARRHRRASARSTTMTA